MFKILVFLLYLLPGNMQPNELCSCPQVSNLLTTGKTTTSYSMSWSGNTAASGYTVKYARLGDGYESPEFSASGTSYTFSNLPAGRYMFQVAAVCNGEKSSFIGVEDLIEN
jgi:hypothetical protein